MRQAEKIWDVWDNGTYVGNNRSHGRVTIEPDWLLHITGKVYGDSNTGPYRWYQNSDNGQTEVEIPNVKLINIDRSVDTDIASATVSIYNQYMDNNGVLPALSGQLGNPGYLSFGHGNSPEAAARWNQSTNSWESVILPNGLVRTYEGYGGYNSNGSPKSIRDAQELGALVLTGAWLIDEVTLDAKGMINLKMRDVGKLLGVQQYFPPLVPSDRYLVQWARWVIKDFDAKFNPRLPSTSGTVQNVPVTYIDSSADRWYGPNADIHGHHGTDSIDGNGDTFAMSVGNYNPAKLYCTDWWEYEVNGKINELYISPWAGNYTMYVSVLENGIWQTNNDGLIPYSDADLVGNNYDDYGNPRWVDTEANIPFVMKTGVPWEQGTWYQLPRTFAAQRIRVTFRDHTYAEWAPWHYRCGIREMAVRVNTLQTSPPSDPWTFSIANHNDPNFGNEAGYYVAADDGQVFVFGDARLRYKNTATEIESTAVYPVVTIRTSSTGLGYWLMQTNGVVHAYGDVLDYGDGGSTGYADYIDMAPTGTNLGYWLLRRNGEVHAFGDAVHHGNATPTIYIGDPAAYTGTSIDSHPTINGYWIVDGNGEVQAFGGVPNYGGITPFRSGLKVHEWTRSIRRNSAGDGYWILGGSGRVYNKGAAQDFGQPIYDADIGDDGSLYHEYRQMTWSIAPTSNDDGFLVLQADGDIYGAGNFLYFGSPGHVGQIRLDGNYRDYSDIVKTLLAWSGFLYYDDAVASDGIILRTADDTPNVPPVYGNIESTGTYSDDPIPLDTFDKKTIIDCINRLKEIVGYIFYIDSEGAARFESPNWWSIGNFWIDGTPTDFIPEVDEATVLTDYSVVWSDETARSEIIITTDNPSQGNLPSTITTRLVPDSSSVLRGIVKPAMWVNGLFKNPKEQKIMAELISLHIWFQQRTGSVTALANPCIGINDQVRIFERTTAETYIHYVRSMSTSHDLDTGQYMMTLGTHWMGDESDWAITRDNIPGGGTINGRPQTRISDDLLEFLRTSNAQSVKVARLNDFNVLPEDTHEAYGSTDPNGSGGAANG